MSQSVEKCILREGIGCRKELHRWSGASSMVEGGKIHRPGSGVGHK